MNDSFRFAYLSTFLEEGREQIATLEHGFSRLESGSVSGKELKALFRAAHSLKGSASVMEYDGLVELAHEIEDSLDALNLSNDQASQQVVASLQRSLGAVKTLFALIERSATSASAPTASRIPVCAMFERMSNMVENLATQMGKKVRLLMAGGETEVELSIFHALASPLTQLLQNSVDHGIETPKDRVKAGKSEIGTIWIAATCDSAEVEIKVQDDGAGISLAEIRKSAIEKGILSESATKAMSNEDTLRLIFASGLSTAKSISSISGRGVGMDVVKSNIERLNGRIEVESKLGYGTTFTIKLPLADSGSIPLAA